MDFYVVLRNKLYLTHFLLAAACLALDKVAVGKVVDLDTEKCFYSQCKVRVRVKGIFLCVEV